MSKTISSVPQIIMYNKDDISTEIPDYVEEAIKKVSSGKGRHDLPERLVVTVAPYIYTKIPLTPDLLVHECQHFHQQGAGLDDKKCKEWWKRYGEDGDFRYEQELEAYQVQYNYMKPQHDRHTIFAFAKNLASILTGGLYGTGYSYAQAVFDIINKKR